LARIYHPDGTKPDSGRMAELNQAYELVRSPDRRRAYAAGPRRQPMGPGDARVTPPPDGADAGAFARAAHRAGKQSGDPSPRLDFGRYMGWSILELAKHDPDYLRWLSRHSAGLRYRAEIQRVLDNVAQRDKATA
jgi:curved DNA-binding protein CbpA